MAISTGINGRGSLANIIFYEAWGKCLMRTKPREVKQTIATRVAATGFGRVKTLSSWIRNCFVSFIPDPRSKPVMFAVDSAVRNWIKYCEQKTGQTSEIPYLGGLSLNNEAANITASLRASINIDWSQSDQLVLTIPELDPENILSPKKTSTLLLKFALLQFDISGELDINKCNFVSQAIDLPFVKGEKIKATSLQIPFTVKKGSIHLVLTSLRYKKGEEFFEEKIWKPVGIVGGYYWKEEEDVNEK